MAEPVSMWTIIGDWFWQSMLDIESYPPAWDDEVR